MKKFKSIMLVLATLAIMLAVPATHSIKASAEEPATYYIKYVDKGDGTMDWRYHNGSVWDTTHNPRELYYMTLDIKNGDKVVIDGSGYGGLDFKLTLPVSLSNLTIMNVATVVVTTNGITDCYVLKNSTAAINGAIQNAYVYDNAVCTFNNDVDTLSILREVSFDATVSTGGTVKHVYCNDTYNQKEYNYYNFGVAKFVTNKGKLMTAKTDFSLTPVEDTATTTPTTPTAPASDSEYDDVPKTGEANTVYVLFFLSALCFAGGLTLRKKY